MKNKFSAYAATFTDASGRMYIPKADVAVFYGEYLLFVHVVLCHVIYTFFPANLGDSTHAFRK